MTTGGRVAVSGGWYYYGSGYLPSGDYWKLGTIFGVIFLIAFLLITVPWSFVAG